MVARERYNRRIAAEMKTIEEMLMTYSTDVEIITILKIPPSTFYRYKARIFKDYAEVFNQRRVTDTGFYTEQLNSRLTKYLKIFESKLDECNAHDAVGIGQLVVDTAKAIFDLNLQGIEILDTIRSLDKKAHTYEITHSGSNSTNNDGSGGLPELDDNSSNNSNDIADTDDTQT